jgi:hypothetical protein
MHFSTGNMFTDISGSNHKNVGLVLERRNPIVRLFLPWRFRFFKSYFNMTIHKLALALLCLCAFASAQDSGGGQQEVGGTEEHFIASNRGLSLR